MGNTSGSSDSRSRMTKKERMRKKKIQRTIGLALSAVLFISMAIFMGLLMYLNVLPNIYVVAVTVVFLLILIYVLLSQFTRSNMVGKIIAVGLSIVLAIGSYYLGVTTGTLNKVSDNSAGSLDVMSVIVMADDSAKAIADTDGYVYGINSNDNETLINEALDHVKDEIGKMPETVTYSSWPEAVLALYGGEVQALIFNESYRSSMVDDFVSFSDDTKVIGEKQIEDEKIVIDVPEMEITDETFIVLISGTDSEGKLTANGRSDVNIVASINPVTKDILLVTVPRDLWTTLYYGDGTDSGSSKDKLTHASRKGLACSIATLEHILSIDIDYYVRLNFTGMTKLVDALGGIDVESDYAFTSYAQTHTFVKGMNHMDGYAALIFARERHAFKDGDFQRARNQVKVIQAIADKALSTKMLTNYTGILQSLEDVVTTNIPADQMSKLVKMQLSDMAKWQFKSYTITGLTGYEYCIGESKPLSIVYPDEASIAVATRKINAIIQNQDPDTVN